MLFGFALKKKNMLLSNCYINVVPVFSTSVSLSFILLYIMIITWKLFVLFCLFWFLVCFSLILCVYYLCLLLLITILLIFWIHIFKFILLDIIGFIYATSVILRFLPQSKYMILWLANAYIAKFPGIQTPGVCGHTRRHRGDVWPNNSEKKF